MDVDSPPPSVVARRRIIQRLAVLGVPEECLKELQPGLVHYMKNKELQLRDIVLAIVPTDVDIAGVSEGKPGSKKNSNLKETYRESMLWLKWLMFEQEPSTFLKHLANLNVDQRGVCGAVWGENDLAFRCRTCELDPTCAICVPCFQNGNHKDHDYSIIYTGGGCCDCGDDTAWKREGFCSKHKGPEQIQPLPKEAANSVGPVLDLLLGFWKVKLLDAEEVLRGNTNKRHNIELRKIANDFSYVVVEVLLDFCNHSESLLDFVSKKLIETDELLNLLVRAERFLFDATKKLHEFLLKLLGEPTFKYEFAKAFIDYYPIPVAEVLRTSSDGVLKKYPLLSLFDVQIFTVPTLTPRLVKEHNLLSVLLECLGEILFSCCLEDGHFQFNKWVGVFDICIRVVEDLKFVLSHSIVANYVIHERIDIVKVWLQLLSLIQGMNAQKRETSIHIEEEHENSHLPFIMCNSIMNIHMLLVKAAFAVDDCGEMDEDASRDRESKHIDDGYSQRHSKVGRLSEESSVFSSVAHSQEFDGNNDVFPSVSVLHLTSESIKALDLWLTGNIILCHDGNDASHSKLSAFKASWLRIKIEMNISDSLISSSMIIDTENSDKDSSIMETEPSSGSESLTLLSLTDWSDIDYDVSSQEISVHMPLHGLLTQILKEALRRYYGESLLVDGGGKSFLNPSSSSSSDHQKFFWKLLGGCHPNGFSSFMMEHPLQSRVFCSQVRAGMWRKNGDAAILCFDWYRAICWSDHVLELDLFLLQLCAAFSPPDLYVRRILERFQLSNYLSLDLKRSSEYEPVLMQELLTLIIQIVKERRFSGLTSSQSLQRELVCKLATGDATHSQLVKSLPKDLSKLDQLQEVLDKIALYSNPSGMNQGKYSLQMPYWKELDLYHPCWNLRDLQVAEERYSQFCGVSALNAQLPKWTHIYQPLIGISRLATCRTIVQVIRAVLFYAVFTDKSTESRSPEGVLITALHLLSLAINICSLERESGNLLTHEKDYNPFLAFVIEEIEVGTGWHGESGRQSLLSLMVLLMRMYRKENTASLMDTGNFSIGLLVESLLKNFAELDSQCMIKLQQFAPEIVNCKIGGKVNLSSGSDTEKRKMKARERQAAIMAKMKAEQSKFLATLKTSEGGSDDSDIQKEEHGSDSLQDSGETHVCCLCHDPNSKNPVSFLILLQKSRTVSFVSKAPPSWDQGWQSNESKSSVTSLGTNLADKVSNASSLESFPHLKQLVESAMDEFSPHAQPMEINAFVDYLKSQFSELHNFHIPGKSDTEKDKIEYSLESLEQDIFLSTQKEISSIHNLNMTRGSEGISSRVDEAISCHDVSLLLGKYIASLTKESKDPSQNSNSGRADPAVQFRSDEFGPSDCDGIHVSSCGHAVHQGCLDRYLSSLKDRLIRRMIFEGGHIVDPDQGEFLCPVCRRLANSTLPDVPSDSHRLYEHPTTLPTKSSSSLTVSNKESRYDLQYAVSMLQIATSFASKSKFLKALPIQRNKTIISNLQPISQFLSGMYFPGKQDNLSKSRRVSPTLLMWDTLKYSIVSIEIAARNGKSSLSSRKGLHSLDDEFRSCGGFILPLLVKIIQSTRSKNLPDVLLRFRGLQLFSASVCSCFSDDSFQVGAFGGEGKILRLLRYSNSEIVFPDMQFWDQASHPILTHDPFSTLMWILFCLPYPFLSSKDCLSLVHLFYGVSIIQAIFTYCSYSKLNVNELGLDDTLVSDIANLAGKSSITKQIFISDYIDSSSHVKDVIYNLSLPYLRRCWLLWKLLNCSDASTSSSRIDDLGKSLDVSDYEEDYCRIGGTDEINILLNMFEIPSLDIVLKDGGLRGMMLKWFHHLSIESDDQTTRRALHLTPLVPFQLMRLPLVYQDLVQRYIKVRCPICEAVQDEPALCLLCGRLCSPAWKSCCSESGCQAHSASCGAGTGVFLLVRKTTILLQRNARQSPWPSPYLDAFGEEDRNLQRGKPLYLNEERYAALNYMVASHGLDRSSKVLRQTTIGTFFMV